GGDHLTVVTMDLHPNVGGGPVVGARERKRDGVVIRAQCEPAGFVEDLAVDRFALLARLVDRHGLVDAFRVDTDCDLVRAAAIQRGLGQADREKTLAPDLGAYRPGRW